MPYAHPTNSPYQHVLGGEISFSNPSENLDGALIRGQFRCVELQVVSLVPVDQIELGAGEAAPPISPLTLPLLENLQGAMDADDENRSALESPEAFLGPLASLEDVVDNNGKPAPGEDRQTAVKVRNADRVAFFS